MSTDNVALGKRWFEEVWNQKRSDAVPEFLAADCVMYATGRNANTAGMGRSGEQAYVNIANGNLVLQMQDIQLAGRGLDLYALPTYNSLGTPSDDDGATSRPRKAAARSSRCASSARRARPT